ncbi:hypothetical protein SCALM49S_07856 [Streptomyces californicus]
MPSETTLSNSPTSSTTTRLGAALISVFPMAWVTVRGNSPAFASVPYSAVFFAASAKSLPPVATAAFFPPPASDFAASPSAPPPLPQADRERAAATARATAAVPRDRRDITCSRWIVFAREGGHGEG